MAEPDAPPPSGRVPRVADPGRCTEDGRVKARPGDPIGADGTGGIAAACFLEQPTPPLQLAAVAAFLEAQAPLDFLHQLSSTRKA
jgi:hypothetical protein